MKRILISETPKFVGKKIKIAGWVTKRRDHGKLIFIDVRDRSGITQVVVIPDEKEAHDAVKSVHNEYVIEIEGIIRERPGGAANEKIATGNVELEAKSIKILSKTEGDLPIDISEKDLNLHLKTLLDFRVLTLRNEKIKSIFKIHSEIIKSYSDFLKKEGFIEIKTPKILSSATEGGANFFKIKYFEKEAYLAQSPQFYKQAGVGIFERVFEVGTVFRAEPHYTTRHVNEFTGLDAEMGFIEGVNDVMDQLEKVLAHIFKSVEKNCAAELEIYNAAVPRTGGIPRMKLTEALDILQKEYGKKMEKGIDIDPEGERLICEWVKKEFDSDLVFLTHYPAKIRPFYVMPSPDPQYTEGFDLLFRGVEIATGGQRIHDYHQLINSIKKHGLKPEDFEHYLDIFKYGMPPHGGWGLGLERIVQKILGLKSIKEAVLFPRDVRRLTP